jgi:hypothetical protein
VLCIGGNSLRRQEVVMRTLIALGLATALLGFGGGPAAAGYQGLWCLNANVGWDIVVERCHFRTFEHCRRALNYSGSSSFCVQNARNPDNWYGRDIAPPQRSTMRKKPRRR